MARVKRGVKQAHARHKKVLKKAKGYYSALYRFCVLSGKTSGDQSVSIRLS